MNLYEQSNLTIRCFLWNQIIKLIFKSLFLHHFQIFGNFDQMRVLCYFSRFGFLIFVSWWAWPIHETNYWVGFSDAPSRALATATTVFNMLLIIVKLSDKNDVFSCLKQLLLSRFTKLLYLKGGYFERYIIYEIHSQSMNLNSSIVESLKANCRF